MPEERPRLVLVDGSSYFYRSYHALPSLNNSAGQPTGAIYGMTRVMQQLRRRYAPTYAAVVFDAPGKTFRDAIYPAYKANRPSMPDELRAQADPTRDIVKALGYPMLMIPGVEADDVIGTLAIGGRKAGMEVLIFSGDKDMAQLVGDSIFLMRPVDRKAAGGGSAEEVRLDAKGVHEKYGVPPKFIIDYLALVGDSSDNVPGVPKVGPKTAAKWLAEYRGLDGLVEHADEIQGKVGESLRASLGQIPLSKDLVTIRCDLDLDAALCDLALKEPDRERLVELYRLFEFKTWLKELESEEIEGSSPADDRNAGDDESTASDFGAALRIDTVLDEALLDVWIERLSSATEVAIALKTTTSRYMRAVPVGLAFCIEPGHAAYIPLGHDAPGTPEQLAPKRVLQRLQPVLESESPRKIGQNLKYDISVLALSGIDLSGVAFDTMLESYVLDSTVNHDLDSLAERYLSHHKTRYEKIAGRGTKRLSFNEITIEQAAAYAAEEAELSLRLHRVLRSHLQAQPVLAGLCDEMEIPLVPILSRIERNGVRVDAKKLRAQSEELASKMHQIEKSAYAQAGRAFNLASAKQIRTILFDEMELPELGKTPKGQPSTSESVLQELAFGHELPRLILRHRALSKLKSTYTDALPECIDPGTGRVHTSYHQAVASTGRLSSSDPNLQNIPVRTPEGRRIRQAFVPDEGHLLLAADYSQIELRIMAHLSGDEGLRSAFASGIDIHRATAAEVFGLDIDAVDDESRRRAKAINFGLIYGMSAFGLARQLGIDRGDAKHYIDLYFSRYPKVHDYMENAKECARQRGFVETVFGRRLHLPDIRSRNNQRRQYMERTAINAPMQGTAADIIKRAMLSIDRWIADSKVPARIIMQVHDELVFEIPKGAVDEIAPSIKQRMSEAAQLLVPLEVDIGIGENWDEAH
ncbi:DNA polymerase I [Thioalkalivibrio sp. HK1]|uniref:DNA polymerase I n=1 Tax=Thioalkalivibrio sp. HK1 TaxID=1469245 RepID=UPI00046F35BA|nr:DNA polymerase I [Thioalkalivibrio sp. HK1]